MRSDFHMHTGFSSDTDVKPEDMVTGAIAKGLQCICITDHYDKDYCDGDELFIFEPEDYIKYMMGLQNKYKEEIDIRIGVEIGLQKHLKGFYHTFTKAYPFDFVIGSAHLLKGADPYNREVFQGVDDRQSYREAFEEMLELVNAIDDFDVLGHLDYVVRYGNEQATHYSYKAYAEIIDEILKTIINKGKGIELNTAGYKYGLGFAHPHPEVLARYKELGGEIITIGSDGHMPEHIAYEFGLVNELLKQSGFKYYTEFKERKPIFCKLL
ncbi:MAG: histidinol-phosphatase HisJ family protein [Eubacteriales bacterium]